MTNGQTFVALCAAALLASGMAQAESPRGAYHAERFDALDTDQSGGLSMAELEAGRMALFAEADSDGNGALSMEEAMAAGRRMGEDRARQMFDRFDEDGDGEISAAEMPAPRNPERRFARLDRDDNGEISVEEFNSARYHRKGRGWGRRNGRWHD